MNWVVFQLWLLLPYFCYSRAELRTRKEPSWVLTGPQIFQKGSNEEVCLYVYDTERSGNVTFVLQFSETYSKEFPFKIGNEDCFTLPIPDVTSQDKKSRLIIYGALGFGFKIVHSKIIRFRDQASLTLIQTHKEAYALNDTVRFRALTLNPELRPISTKFEEVRVLDPSGHTFQEWTNVTNGRGLLELETKQLNKLGPWRITVKNTLEVSEEFIVYPSENARSFRVGVYSPEKIPIGSEELTVEICSVAPNGTSLTFYFNLILQPTISSEQNLQTRRKSDLLRIDGKGSGCVTTKLNLTSQSGLTSKPGVLQLTTSVTVPSLNVNETISKRVKVGNPELQVKFSDQRYFKVGIPYLGQAQFLTDSSKDLVANLTLQICITAPSHFILFQECIETQTDQHGAVEYSFIPDEKEITKYTIVIKSNLSNDSWNSHWSINLYQVYSMSGYALEFGRPSTKVGCGNLLELPLMFVGLNKDNLVAQLQFMSGGKVRQRTRLDLDFSRGEPIMQRLPNNLLNRKQSDEKLKELLSRIRIFNISYNTTTGDVPEITILAFSLLPNGGLLTTFRKAEIEPCFPNPVRLLLSENKVEKSVIVSTNAYPGSVCGIILAEKTISGSLPRNFLMESRLLSQLSSMLKAPGVRQAKCDEEYCKQNQKKAGNYKFKETYVDSIRVFDHAKLIVASNHDIWARPCQKIVEKSKDDDKDAFDYDVYGEADLEMTKDKRINSICGKSRTRQDEMIYSHSVTENQKRLTHSEHAKIILDNLPETWFWDNFTLRESYHHIRFGTEKELVGQAFCVSEEHGFGMSSATSFQSTDLFSVSVVTPKTTIKKGETIDITLFVSNKISHDLPVSVVLLSKELKLKNGQSSKCIKAEEEVVFGLEVYPTVAGNLELKIKVLTAPSAEVNCGPEVLPYAAETIASSFDVREDV